MEFDLRDSQELISGDSIHSVGYFYCVSFRYRLQNWPAINSVKQLNLSLVDYYCSSVELFDDGLVSFEFDFILQHFPIFRRDDLIVTTVK